MQLLKLNPIAEITKWPGENGGYGDCEVLENIKEENVNGFWCDSVLQSEPGNYYSQKFINDNRQAKMKAYVGKDRQPVYNLKLKFRTNALSR